MKKSLIQRLSGRVEAWHTFLTVEVWELGKPGDAMADGFVIQQIRVAFLLVKNFVEDKLLLRAAALTFATALAIVPVFMLTFYLIQTFNLGEGMYAALNEQIETRLNQAISVVVGEDAVEVHTDDDDAAAPTTEEIEERRAELNRQLMGMFADWAFQGVAQGEIIEDGEELANPVEMLISYAESGARELPALGLTAVALVLMTVIGLMRNIEQSFSQIWRSKRSRPFHRMVMDYILVTLFLPIVAAGVLAINVAVQSEAVTETFGIFALPLRGFQLLIIVLMFALMYWAVPNAPVKWRYAILGGIVAGIGWVLVSHAYVTFNFGLSRFNMLYAGFAQFPLLLMWVYASWVVILFGAELTFAYQNVKTFAMERFADTASFAYREAVALRTMLAMARRFEAGEGGIVPQQCAEEWNVPTRVIDDTLDRLGERGLVTELATVPPSYQPAKSLHHTSLREVVEAIREYGKEPSKLREDEALRDTFAEVALKNNTALDVTLADWAATSEVAGEEPRSARKVTPLRS